MSASVFCAEAPPVDVPEVDHDAQLYDFAVALADCDVHYALALLAGLADASQCEEFARLLACASDVLLARACP